MIYYKFPNVEQPIGFDESKINVLVIENPTVLYKTVLNLLSALKKEESEFKFLTQSDIYKEVDKVFFAHSVFDLDINSKKVLTIISKQLTAVFQKNEFEINEYYAQGYNMFLRFAEELDIPLTLNDSVDFAALIKLFNPIIDESYHTLLEKMIELTNILVKLTNLKIVVTLNIQDYLTQDEIESFFKHCRYKEISWLSIQANKRYDYAEEHCVLIDNDLCQILE